MPNLTEAVQLIQQKQFTQAQKILEPILKAEPKNIQAWFWYVETWPSLEKRIKTLEVCLQINPGQMQVSQALQALRTKQMKEAPTAPPPQPIKPVSAPVMDMEPPDWAKPSVPAATPAPTPARSATAPTPTPTRSAVAVDLPDWLMSSSTQPEPKTVPKPAVQSTSAFSYDEEPQPQEEETSHPSWLQPRGESRPAFDWDEIEGVSSREPETPAPVQVNALEHQKTEPKPTGNVYAFHQVWLTALTAQSVPAYAALLDDPESGAGRAFEWMAYTGVVTGLLSAVSVAFNPSWARLMATPEMQGTTGSLGATAILLILGLVMAILTPIFSVLGLAINAAFQNLLAGMFGGTGNYSRTAYALGAYLAPYGLIAAVLGIIPFVGQCLLSLAGFYIFVLNVRALQAAHNLNTGRALGAILAPTLLFLFICCILGLVLMPSLSGVFESINNSLQPTY